MITKFICKENYNSLEFKKESNSLLVTISHLVKSDTLEIDFLDVRLTEQNLFDLIGQLLRVQSEIRKEAQNG